MLGQNSNKGSRKSMTRGGNSHTQQRLQHGVAASDSRHSKTSQSGSVQSKPNAENSKNWREDAKGKGSSIIRLYCTMCLGNGGVKC